MSGAKQFLLFKAGARWYAAPPGFTNAPGELAGWGNTRQAALRSLMGNPEFKRRALAESWNPRPSMADFFVVAPGTEISWDGPEPMLGTGFKAVSPPEGRPHVERIPEGRLSESFESPGAWHIGHYDKDGEPYDKTFKGKDAYERALAYAFATYEIVEVGQPRYPAEDMKHRFARRRRELVDRGQIRSSP